MAVVSASLPTLRPLVVKLAPSSKRKIALNKFSRSIVTIGGSDKHSHPRKEGIKRQEMGDEFRQLPDGGTESFAFYHVPDDIELRDHKPDARNGITVTNMFSTTHNT